MSRHPSLFLAALFILPLAPACGPEESEADPLIRESEAAPPVPEGLPEAIDGTDEVGSVEQGLIAPSCVYRYADFRALSGWHVHIKNNCSRTMRVKVRMDKAPDSGCRSMGPGAVWNYWAGYGDYRYVETC